MLTKIRLFHQIQKFYQIFGEEIGTSFITKLSDMTTDNVHDVLFDISEIREVSDEDPWLDNLQNQVIKFCYKSPITINTILFNICNTKKHGFYELRRGTKPIYKFAQWLYKKGI